MENPGKILKTLKTLPLETVLALCQAISPQPLKVSEVGFSLRKDKVENIKGSLTIKDDIDLQLFP